MKRLWFFTLLLALAACGGSGPSAPQSTAGQPASTGTVRLRTGPIHSKVGLSQQSVGGERYLVHHTDDPLTIWDQNTFSDIYLEDRDQGTCDLISRAVTGQSDGASEWATVSRDGRFVAFESTATNLVANDTNGRKDVFLYDGQTHEIRRLSTGLAGAEANGDSYDAQVSANGNLVAFVSRATNLVTGDGNGTADVFLYDIAAQTLKRVNLTAAGDEVVGSDCDQPTIYEDGNFVVYVSSGTNLPGANGIPQIYATRPKTGKVWLASRNTGGESANGACSAPTFGGRTHLTFTSAASNLAADDSNGVTDVFVVSKDTLVPFLASRDDGGTPLTGNSRDSVLSSDGTKLVFVTDTGGAAHDFGIESRVIRRDLTGGTNTIVSDPDEFSDGVGISDSGNFVAFATITTHQTGPDESEAVLFDHDATVPETKQITSPARLQFLVSGFAAFPTAILTDISADGRFVVFETSLQLDAKDTNSINDVYVYDRDANVFELISTRIFSGSGFQAVEGAISADGRYVVFSSGSNELVPGDTNNKADIFLRDRQLATTERVSLPPVGQTSEGSIIPSISADGRYVAYRSWDNSLVPGDNNSELDLFLHDRVSNTTLRIAEAPIPLNPNVGNPASFTDDNRFLCFESLSDGVVPADNNGESDIFIYDLSKATIELVSVGHDGSGANAGSHYARISGNGEVVAFISFADNLVLEAGAVVNLYVRDLQTQETTLVGPATVRVDISSDARFIATGGAVFDRQLGASTRIDINDDGVAASDGSFYGGVISADGRYAGFGSTSSNMPDGEGIYITRIRASSH